MLPVAAAIAAATAALIALSGLLRRPSGPGGGEDEEGEPDKAGEKV